MLGVDGLTVTYGATRAVDDVYLDVRQGEVVCVLGPSGSGKSTLLRAIAGLERPDTGRITWDHADITDLPPHKRELGLMFQDHALFPHLDVFGNVAFGLRMKHLGDKAIRSRVAEALTLVNLPGFERRRVNELSGGEQQRVALARALAPAPRLLMLDEPLGSLDRALRERLMVELHDLFTSRGITALFVTHDHDEAFALADRVVVMRRGRVEQQGEPQDVWRRPTSEFTARFLGFENVVDAQVAEAHFGEPVARSEWGLLPVPEGTPAGPARLALRPDALRVVPNGPMCGVVETRTFRRDHFLVRVVLSTGTPVEVMVAPDDLPEVGATVRLGVDPDGIVVLPIPRANGRR
ncbi:MAG TPA: ABC transporter ATP-binding protein [Acidimicrobiia bacterium]|nr:ABC transporter ATP-binding protein [Acidimicrobiia bacterium]